MEEECGGSSLKMEGGNAQGPEPHGWLLMSSALGLSVSFTICLHFGKDAYI